MAAPARGQPPPHKGAPEGAHAHGAHGPAHAQGHAPAHGRHGNPEDLAAYLARMEDPERDSWQRPDEVIRALGLKKGQTLCDIGAGPGYFALRIARAVGPRGHVLAVDVDETILAALRDRIARATVHNVTPVLSLPGDPLLPAGACDRILIVDTYHHFPDGVAYLKTLVRALAPRGRLVNIDFHKRELPLGPPPEHKVAREDFLRDARAAGLRVVDEPTFLPHQYFLILRPAAR
jgi:SAM-dependent methyltransferase